MGLGRIGFGFDHCGDHFDRRRHRKRLVETTKQLLQTKLQTIVSVE